MLADGKGSRGFIYSLSFGIEMRSLLSVQGKSLQQTIRDKAQDIIGLLNKLSYFEGSLVLQRPADEGVTSSSVPILASYKREKKSHYALITTDALPEIAAKGLSELATWTPTVDTVLFLGHQNPQLTASGINGTALLRKVKEQHGVTLPKIYIQMDDLLADAEQNPHDADASVLHDRFPYSASHARKRSILVGNGINRTNTNNEKYSWNEIITALANDNAVNDELGILSDKGIPSPTKFEYLALHADVPTRDNVFRKLKRDIAQMVNGDASGIELPSPSIQEGLRSLHMDHWLTTNYDLVLEKCLGCTSVSYTEQKYLLHRTAFVNNSIQGVSEDGADVFHIHGIASKGHEGTICIGYEHYMGYVQWLRGRLIKEKHGSEVAQRVVHLLLGTTERSNTWEELFFTSDMAIVGLGFDFEETDLWELLILRAAVLRTSDALAKSGIPESAYKNRITYYEVEKWSEGQPVMGGLPCIDERYWGDSPKGAGKMNALRGLDVDVRIAHARDYIEGYLAIFEELKAAPEPRT